MSTPQHVVEIFRIVDRGTGSHEGAYSRGYRTEYDFPSPDAARNSNCHGIFKDRDKFKVAKYRVTYELIEDDVP